MSDGQKRWEDLVAAFRAEDSALGGWAEVAVAVTYHDGAPHDCIAGQNRLPRSAGT
jgi:hypothetical protein